MLVYMSGKQKISDAETSVEQEVARSLYRVITKPARKESWLALVPLPLASIV